MRKLKFIWDFYGPDALKTAEHHEKHLKDYLAAEMLAANTAGFQAQNDRHAIAYLIVEEQQIKAIADALKPHRGIYMED